jgi:hypothetical protein
MSIFWLLAAIWLGVVALTLLRTAMPSLMYLHLFGPDHIDRRWYRAGPLFIAWHHLLYGWLFAGAFALIHRVERTRAVLARAELARSQSETLLAQAELSILRGAVDPAFLLRVLDEARQRQADAAHPDALLERLVDFLRLAMPGIRSGGGSTLRAELAVMASRMQLAGEIEPSAPRLQCDVDPLLADLPFLPLLLLPFIEHMVSAAASGGVIAVQAARDERGATLTLTQLGSECGCGRPDDLLRRLRIGLQATYGQAAKVTWHGDATRQALRMALAPLPFAEAAALGAADAAPQPPPSQGGTLPWNRLATRTN